MRYFFVIVISSIFFLNSCSKVRESAGATRKTIDEFQVIENPPLVIPPNFNLLPPDQLEEKDIDSLEKDLAQEILFGLDKNNSEEVNNLSTMNQILNEINAFEISPLNREEFDKDFAQELKTDGIFEINWKNEVEVLDAVKESQRIRDKNYLDKSIVDGEVPKIKKTIKVKKKKRFFFF